MALPFYLQLHHQLLDGDHGSVAPPLARLFAGLVSGLARQVLGALASTTAIRTDDPRRGGAASKWAVQSEASKRAGGAQGQPFKQAARSWARGWRMRA